MRSSRGQLIPVTIAALVVGCTSVLGIDGDVDRINSSGNGGASSTNASGQATSSSSLTTSSGGLLPDGSECSESNQCLSNCCLGVCEPNASCTGDECEVPSDCGQSTECRFFDCENGNCQMFQLSDGEPVETQTAGDCTVRVCDNEGNVQTINDDADAPPDTDTTDCTFPTCVAGTIDLDNEPDSQPCGGDPTRLCCDGVCCASGEACNASICTP